MMTNDDPEGRVFLSYPHTHNHDNGLFFLHTTVLFIYSFVCLFFYLFIYLFIYLFLDKLPEIPKYAKMQFT